MSDVEFECRVALMQAYAIWRSLHGLRPLNMLAYGRALGLSI